MRPAQAREILGLPVEHSVDDLRRARRRMLLRAHPDHGGTADHVALVHQAVAVLQTRTTGEAICDDVSTRFGRDCPSFTISVLPVEAYELLLIAAAELGELADDEPPYRMEVRMSEPTVAWVTFEVVPDAGSSTVTMSVESSTAIDLDAMRDLWVDTLNRL